MCSSASLVSPSERLSKRSCVFNIASHISVQPDNEKKMWTWLGLGLGRVQTKGSEEGYSRDLWRTTPAVSNYPAKGPEGRARKRAAPLSFKTLQHLRRAAITVKRESSFSECGARAASGHERQWEVSSRHLKQIPKPPQLAPLDVEEQRLYSEFFSCTSIMKVTAIDADDPTYGSSARVVYSVLDGEKFFTVERHTGIIMTAVADLDRETQDRYELVVKATDMAGQLGGLSGSTTVTIVITDVNDNPPRFPQKMYQFTVSEGAAVGTPVGQVMATDADMGENTDMTYLIKEGGDLFKVSTNVETQEAVVSIKKPLDFETKRTHNVVVEAVNKHVDPRFVTSAPSGTRPSRLCSSQQGHCAGGAEDAKVGALVGVVSARDPDVVNKPVRFSIDRSLDQEMIFHIDPDTGALTLGKILDRETAGWHNITVKAVEAEETTEKEYVQTSRGRAGDHTVLQIITETGTGGERKREREEVNVLRKKSGAAVMADDKITAIAPRLVGLTFDLVSKKETERRERDNREVRECEQKREREDRRRDKRVRESVSKRERRESGKERR
ncbi:hypothetical protein WMY93_008665 [Mugilogobius chulae]|uniref:Cadherin domain-containing protein n=1 Tax=Mugilogobius chulae TaxID=88201 RepID=A0AAW0PQT0_9GOBI